MVNAVPQLYPAKNAEAARFRTVNLTDIERLRA